MSPVVTMRQLLDAGVHFGHQTRRWNPKMQRFIFGERDGIYIIDLRQTLAHIESAYIYVRDLVAQGGQVLFVGTKKQAQDSVQSYAERVGMPYINERWLGGLLTNFETISKRMGKMKEFQRMRSSGELEVMPKKEALLISRELAKLERNLNGIRDLAQPPDAVFVLDTKKEHIAVAEANKLKLPVIAVVDTNCDPDVIQYVIPGNDDAIRSGELMCRVISEAVIEGRYMAHANQPAPVAEEPAVAKEEAVLDEKSPERSQEIAEETAAEAEDVAESHETAVEPADFSELEDVAESQEAVESEQLEEAQAEASPEESESFEESRAST
ncbi:MAG: 30S ribosomal protein S2 [Acidimicrobiia bacterium]|nr:30S ribosomal protein S2 [Acidimicrobiia bacterium]MYC57270.1 30S ribosomal protein S2 [Acidimicrobiia bacterium]MYG94474.1 30S ribosomal protein S2 [Acidimicrobiia bacterium]MYI30940.1 30S ribosomal protein S2 [Acidimicrobiia bacterium]